MTYDYEKCVQLFSMYIRYIGPRLIDIWLFIRFLGVWNIHTVFNMSICT